MKAQSLNKQYRCTFCIYLTTNTLITGAKRLNQRSATGIAVIYVQLIIFRMS